MGSIANDGTWIEPHLVRRVYDPQSGITQNWAVPKARQAVSSDTAKLVRTLLAQNIAPGQPNSWTSTRFTQ